MRLSFGKLGLLRWVFMAIAGLASFTVSAQLVFKDQTISSVWEDSLLFVGTDDRAHAGMTLNDLNKLVRRVADQGKALDELRAGNETLNREVKNQAQKIASLESKQGDGGRNSDSQKNELDRLSRVVDNQKNALDKLSRSVAELSNANNSSGRKANDLQKYIEDVKRSVDDLRSRVK